MGNSAGLWLYLLMKKKYHVVKGFLLPCIMTVAILGALVWYSVKMWRLLRWELRKTYGGIPHHINYTKKIIKSSAYNGFML